MPRPPARTEPTADEIHAFLAAWPPGIARLQREDGGDAYGLLMRRAEEVVWATAGRFEAPVDPVDLAERASRAVLEALAAAEPPVGAAAWVRPEPSGLGVGVAVFAFGEDEPERPGAGRRGVAEALLDAVAAAVDAPLVERGPVPYEALGTFRLEALRTEAGLLWVDPSPRPADDPAWDALGLEEVVHLPSVGFVDETGETAQTDETS